MNAVAKINTPFRVGQWLPSDHEILNNWLEELIQELSLKGEQSLHPVIQKFKDFIENDAEVYMLFSLMFTQVNHKKDPSGNPQVDLPNALAAGSVVYGRSFNPMIALKALSFFDDLPTLSIDVRKRLSIAVASVDPASLPILTPYAKRTDENEPTS